MNPLQKSVEWIKANKGPLITIALIVFAALIPLYGVRFPSVVDMPEHISVSKLLWEKLTGRSHLDLTISWYLGYRLFPILMLFLFSFCNLFPISSDLPPPPVAGTPHAFHAGVLLSLLYRRVPNKSLKTPGLAGFFLFPAVGGM